ncbi:Zinc transporter ZIP9 [Hondaea fermentalgiana]|uniref:Zinc transporter ZIP9 n=1 Tax=Hondaea fermentalgiana TaxID=2315210 RepID=A0A2R5GLB0_9STRA|nr:Zinc transporter ZIP9 [Hondaea fermentalgiana]|eukprot:GBG31667.1 Zinc transporter ZIP9 [Hondaea fermentalgiana]
MPAHLLVHEYPGIFEASAEVEMQQEEPTMQWQPFLELCILSIAMFVGAFGAGLAPLHVSMNHKQLRAVNALAAGLFIGTALTVIIPEGVHSLHEAEEASQSGKDQLLLLTPESIIGLALLSGFLLMLCVDHLLGQGTHAHEMDHALSGHDKVLEQSAPTTTNDAVSENDGPGIFRLQGVDEMPSQLHMSKRAVKRRVTVTIGLLIHAAADGLALGATKASGVSGGLRRVELMVFVAIMMHKVPAAFGLSVYLRNTGLDIGAVRANIAYFAIAAPASALLIFALLDSNFVGIGLASPNFVGFGILFSAGTFLYVSMVHALAELPRNEKGVLDQKQLGVVILGSILPLVLGASHSHDD